MQDEKGLATVESIISLTIFMLSILAVLSIINMCFVEAKISSALSLTAREMSQYAYFYDQLGAKSASEKMREKSETIVNAFSTFTTAMDDTKELGAAASTELNSLLEKGFSEENIKNGVGTLEGKWESAKGSASDVITLIKKAKGDPKTYLVSMAAWGAGKITDTLTNKLAGALSCSMASRHFANLDLEKMGVVGGFDGINFDNSSMFTADDPSVIRIVVVYELKLADYLPFDISITVRQTAVTRAWFGDK